MWHTATTSRISNSEARTWRQSGVPSCDDGFSRWNCVAFVAIGLAMRLLEV